MKILICTMALLLLVAGCSSTTLITVDDKNVKIYVDGQYVGKGEYTHTDTKIIGSTTLVTLKKEGCEERVVSFARNEEFDAGACAGGVFTLVPFLWIEKYKPIHNYEFECNKK